MTENTTHQEPQPPSLEEAVTGAINSLKSFKGYLSVVRYLCEIEIETKHQGFAVQDAIFGMMDYLSVDGPILYLEDVLEASRKGATS